MFFDSSRRPEQTIKQYLSAHRVDLNTDAEIDRNQTQGNEHKETLASFLQEQLDKDPGLLNKLMNKYREDYTLWNMIT